MFLLCARSFTSLAGGFEETSQLGVAGLLSSVKSSWGF